MNKSILSILLVLICTYTRAQLFIEPSFGSTYKPSIGYATQWDRNFRPEVFASYDLSYSSTLKRNMASLNLGLLLLQNKNPILQVTPHVGVGYYTTDQPDDYGWQFVYGVSVGVDIHADFDSRLGIITTNSDRMRIGAFWRIYLWDTNK